MTGALRAVMLALVLSGLVPPASAQEIRHDILDFSDLQGWEADDHAAALEVFQTHKK